MAEGHEFAAADINQPPTTAQKQETGEQVQNVLDTETPLQQEVSSFVDRYFGGLRNLAPIDAKSLEFSSAFMAPDSSHIENDAAAQLRLELTNMPEGMSQAFVIGGTLDGDHVRLQAQTCGVVNERLKLCAHTITRIGSDDNGRTNVMGYALADLFKVNAMVGFDRNTNGEIVGFYELGKTLNVPDSDVSVTLAVGGYGPDDYGRLAADWAVREGIDLRLQVFVPDGGDAQTTITVAHKFD